MNPLFERAGDFFVRIHRGLEHKELRERTPVSRLIGNSTNSLSSSKKHTNGFNYHPHKRRLPDKIEQTKRIQLV